MTQLPPAQVGMPLDEVDTPALILELDAFESNLRTMTNAVAPSGLRLRPHAKTHKCPAIALRQIELGAVGVCCQKVGEAEAMVRGGVKDVYVSNEVVGASKVIRLAALAREAKVSTCVDDPVQVTALSRAAADFGSEIDVFVEVDVGANRCGTPPGEPAAQLARRVADAPGLRLAGIQAYQGSAQHLRSEAERSEAIQAAVAQVNESKEAMAKAGLSCDLVTGAGTGTFSHERDSGTYGELQVGSYIFMDADYARNLDAEDRPVSTFLHSLFIWCTVMSHPTPGKALVDAGLKAYSMDSGPPVVAGLPGVEFERASDEHGRLAIKESATSLAVSDKLKLIPGHCDPTVNLYDWYVCIRNNRVEALWPITARGALA